MKKAIVEMKIKVGKSGTSSNPIDIARLVPKYRAEERIGAALLVYKL